MQVVCPNCNAPIDSTDIKPGAELICTACGSSIRLERSTTTGWQPSAGRRLGKFELLDVVGSGGFGTVYKARDAELDRVVAVKVPHAGRLAAPGESDRFLREARSVASLRHASIVSVHEVAWDDGIPYLVEDFVDGITLADMLTGEAPDARTAAELVAKIADALAYAHERGVVHRDVKSSNVMLERIAGGTGYTPRLMDFGLAKREGADATMTQEGQVIGTPAYMSPEQARGEGHRVDGRTDVYSLGVILYQMLTGQLPFKGNARMILHNLLHDEPKSPRKVTPAIPRDLETICLKAMAKEPERRYQSATEFAADLRRFLAGEPIRARRVGAGERFVLWVRRRPTQAALAGLLLLVAVGGTVLGIWLWQRELDRRHGDELTRQQIADQQALKDAAKQIKTQFFLNTIKRRGVLEGIGPLTEEQARHAGRSFKFYSLAGRVEKIECLKGAEYLIDNAGEGTFATNYITDPRVIAGRRRECRYEYRYNDQGQVSEEVALDQRGRVIWVFHYTIHGREQSTGHYTDDNGFPRARTGSGASYVKFLWNPEGFEAEVRYLDRLGRPLPLPDGTWGVRKEFDDSGMPTRQTYLGSDGKPVYHRELGYAVTTIVHDAKGSITAQSYFAPDGKPVRHGPGWDHRNRIHYDDFGNIVKFELFGPDGEPTLQSCHAAYWTHQYDDRGNQIAGWHWGLKGEPVLSSYGCFHWTKVFDERGNEVEWHVFGIDDKPTVSFEGYSSNASKLNEFGQATEWACFGIDGQPVICAGRNCARLMWKYDGDGNEIESAAFGLDGKPTRDGNGVSIARSHYDDQGNHIEWAVFGPDGLPTLNREGFHKVTRTFDDRGNMQEEHYFGTDGKPVITKAGFASIRRTLNERGLMTEDAVYGLNEERVLSQTWVAWTRHKYDDRGLETELDAMGLDGKLTINSSGWAIARQTRDDRGRLIEESYFDRSGKPVLHKTSGAHRVVMAYDDWGRKIEESFFDDAGKPTLHKDGYWKWRARFDERGRQVEGEDLGLHGRLVANRNTGVARWTMGYDAHGHVNERAYFGADGRPTINRHGIARETYVTDALGHGLEVRYFSLDGKPVMRDGDYAGFLARYDPRGNRIEETYLGLDGKPGPRPNGIAKTKMSHDDRDNEIRETYFGADDEPRANANGFAGLISVYDPRDNVIEVLPLGLDGKQLRGPRGPIRVAVKHDSNDRERESTIVDPDGKPKVNSKGWHRKSTDYDERGLTAAEAFFDIEGKPVIAKQGYARVTHAHDERGNGTVSAFFDANGQPVMTAEGYARVQIKFNLRDQPTETRWHDAAGKLVIPKDGFCARIAREYDSYGSITAEAYFGTDDKPILSPRGCARTMLAYDDNGNQTDSTFFDVDGKQLPARVIIQAVGKGSAAEKAGLQAGDVLLKFAGQPVTSLAKNMAIRRAQTAPAELVVLRDGMEKSVQVGTGILGVQVEEKIGPMAKPKGPAAKGP